MNLLPKDDRFFHLFERHSQLLCRAAKLLISGLNDGYDGAFVGLKKIFGSVEEEGIASSTIFSAVCELPSLRRSIRKTFNRSPPRSITSWTALKTSPIGSQPI